MCFFIFKKRQKKKHTVYSVCLFLFCETGLFRVLFELCEAGTANVFAFVVDYVACVVAENASRLIFFEQDVIVVNKDLDRIFFVEVKCTSQLDRQNDSAQVVNSSDDAC